MSEAATPQGGNRRRQINNARLTQAAVLIAEGDRMHQHGDDCYRMAADEIIAARKTDPKLSITRIARHIGRSRPWVRLLIEWRESGESATSTPWTGRSSTGTDDRPVSRSLANEESGIIFRQMIRRTEEEMAASLPEACDLEGRIRRWAGTRKVTVSGEDGPEGDVPHHVRHYMEMMKRALSRLHRKDEARAIVRNFRTALDRMVEARRRRDRATAERDAVGMLAGEYDEKQEALALATSWRALHRLMLEDLEAD